jgi:phospho-N-acetylmuramoyl-pentapeptide-transferase
MGGVVFAIVAVVVSLLFTFATGTYHLLNALVIAVAAFCGLIGFADDYAKVASKSNIGIKGQKRLALETIAGLVLGGALVFSHKHFLLVPGAAEVAKFLGGTVVGLPAASLNVWQPINILFVLLTGFLVAATSNAVNLTDGMDGLATGTTCQVFATIAVMLLLTGQTDLAIIAATAAGALCGFLVFNQNPAKIFMGDTGSLFIGGLMAALVAAGGLVFWFIPLSLIYVAEALSVMAQFSYFRVTKKIEGEEKIPKLKLFFVKLLKRHPGEGKRLFRMTPLHHHYEIVLGEAGISEAHVVARFWIAQFVLCSATLAAFFLLLK